MNAAPREHSEVVHHEYVFAEEYVEAILSGEKSATIRYDDERCVRPGERIAATTPTGERFATLVVEAAARVRLRHVLSFIKIRGGNYPHANPSAIIEALSKHYPNAEIAPETVVHPIVFTDESGDQQP